MDDVLTMRIGIAAPCPLPYMSGGAERLWRGLRNYINSETCHQADIIKLPVDETSFWNLIKGYKDFSALDLSGFDLIISGKYPAWMVEHPRHVVYMLHPCRGLYECYQGAPFIREEWRRIPQFESLLDLIDRNRGDRSVLAELFASLDEICVDPELKARVRWPGPIARAVILFLDQIALNPSSISKYVAISGQLPARDNYFPKGIDVEVAYPPSALLVEPKPSRDYIFTASRLDGYKRVDVLVSAMAEVKFDIAVKIAGTGPEFARLQELASKDPRIELLGYQSDSALADLYAHARGVVFLPYQEDYGLVAVEAMMAGKPVITAIDSGGPAELVTDGLTGYVVKPSPKEVAQAIENLCSDSGRAESMGRAGLEFVRAVSWSNVLAALTSGEAGSEKNQSRIWGTRGLPHLAVTVTFGIFPPRHGGQARVFHLYRNLAHWFDITIVASVPAHEVYLDREISPGLREIRVPISRQHQKKERQLYAKFGVPVDDMAVMAYWQHSPQLVAAVELACRDAVAAVACHPYFYPLIRSVASCPIWYEAQDVEAQIKEAMLPQGPQRDYWVSRVRDVEQACCDEANIILACSQNDSDTLARLYRVTAGKVTVVPNGTDLDAITFRDQVSRRGLKKKLFPMLEPRPLVLFMGSGHNPNLEAVEQIFQFAVAIPAAAFLVLGSSCYAFDPMMKPENVWFLGQVPETEKFVVMEIADIAINPMLSGSGTNVKMLDYLAAGLPTISTAIGSRGLELVPDEHVLIADLDQFSSKINQLLGDAELRDRLVRSGRRFVEEKFGWRCITQKLYEKLQLHMCSVSPVGD
ncbi:MAG: glycosyltransferase [Methylococcus sp.]|nr:glycosyltransferase [Methylococcus sp.]